MEPKTRGKLVVAFLAIVSLIVGATLGITFGKNVFETLLIAIGGSAAMYISLIIVGYLVGIVTQIIFAFIGLSLFFKGKND
jgi:hypothetical protein